MAGFAVRRLLQMLVVLFVLSFVGYGLLGLMPGDPLDIACQANPDCTPETLAQMKENLGLDRPLPLRYGEWLGGILQGDLGYSRTYRVPVEQILLPRLANTLLLGGSALVLSLLVAIPLGVFASLRPNSKTDYAINFFAFAGISTPSFWLGLMLIVFFSVQLGVLPAGGTQTVEAYGSMTLGERIWDRAVHLVLPVMTLSVLTIANWVRYTRGKMLEALRGDFIRTARAKGIPERHVVGKHGLANALIPVVTVVALGFSTIFSGAVITETVFAYQGTGKLLVDSIYANDYNTAMCSFLLTSLMVLVMNFVADVLYAYLDPRVSYSA